MPYTPARTSASRLTCKALLNDLGFATTCMTEFTIGMITGVGRVKTAVA